MKSFEFKPSYNLNFRFRTYMQHWNLKSVKDIWTKSIPNLFASQWPHRHLHWNWCL